MSRRHVQVTCEQCGETELYAATPEDEPIRLGGGGYACSEPCRAAHEAGDPEVPIARRLDAAMEAEALVRVVIPEGDPEPPGRPDGAELVGHLVDRRDRGWATPLYVLEDADGREHGFHASMVGELEAVEG